MAFSSAGIEAVHLVYEDTNGQVVGGSPTLGNDAYSAAYNMLGVTSFNFTIPTPNQEQVTGDNGSLFAFTFPPSDLPTGTMTYSISNSRKGAELRGGSTVKLKTGTTDEDDAYIVNSDAFRQRTAWVITHQPAKNGSLANFGNAGYGISFYRLTISYTGQQGMSFQSPTEYNYELTGALGSKTFWGSSYATLTGNNDTLGAGHADHFNPYPVVPVVYRGANPAVTSSTLPTGLSIVDIPEPIIAYRNGQQLTLASDALSVGAGEWFYDTSTRAITYDTDGVGADDYVVMLVSVNTLRTGALS